MSCVARPHQTPIGTASNFLQCKWFSCSKSYWQGYDLAWYKDMEAPCFPQPNLLARCASRSWAALRKFVVLSAQASKQQQQQAAASSSKQQARSKQAASKQQASKPASKQQASSKQQQAAASSSKQLQQQAAGKQQQATAAAGKQQQASSSKQAAASKQQPAFAPLKEWTKPSFKNQRDTKNWTFSRSTALKQWTISITKSCDDAKLELFPGARPPDTTFRNWYDLNRALVWSSKNPMEIHGFDPQKPLKRFNRSL